jgi:phytoene dehydrogenase-like protein
MSSSREPLDAVVVGAGPNGLAAAITMARAGRRVTVLEANETAGGGVRSGALTLPGFVHDLCSAVYALAEGSPFLRSLPLAEHGLSLVHPPAPLAHPLDDGRVAVLERDLGETARGLGTDGPGYLRLMGSLTRRFHELAPDLLAPMRFPRHPVALAGFGLVAVQSAASLLRRRLRGDQARALVAGLAAHSFVPLERALTAAFGLVLGAGAHAVGWPFARGGAQAVADALVGVLRSHGGTLETQRRVTSLDELPPARTVLLDLTPRQVLALAGDLFPARYRGRLAAYRYGPAVFKLDYALDDPVPWTAPACRRAGVVHLGGTLAQIAAAELDAWEGRVPARPFTLVAQPSLFDPTRAPAGKHTLWVYAHVPHACADDLTDLVEAQIERFAPGFRDRILARAVRGPTALEAGNANLVGGDINGGAQDARQFLARPALRLDPYRTPAAGVFICSSSTPPGGGVHGMCGHLAALSALRSLQRGHNLRR